MLETFRRFERNLAMAGRDIDPYRVSHPLPRERIAAMEELAKASPHFNKTDPASLQVRHDMARAKILAYSYGRGAAEALARDKPGSRAARYGQAIATFLYGNPREGARALDGLIAEDGRNPFLHELKGEALLLAGDADGAVSAFSRAVDLTNGREPMMLMGLGHALVLKGDQQSLRRAVGELEVAISLDPVSPTAYRHLAMAYGRLNDQGNALLASAEESFHSGRYDDAKRFAARAKRQFSSAAPQWLRADDIQRFKVPDRR